MLKKLLVNFILLFTCYQFSIGQPCTTIGQTPATAFPVCGTTVFQQTTVPFCSTNNLFVPGCSGDGADYENKNPYWYKFTCYASGTLGFLITPNDANDDYDWQLYDITGLSPNAVFSNHNIIVAGNWAGTYGPTGASSTGVNGIQCASIPADNLPTFAQMPNLIQGHEYILLISHFTNTQSGYSLSFGGGTANITDPKLPRLLTATAPCDGSKITIKSNKKLRCNSLASNGSDFSINVAGVNVIAASTVQCSPGFDFDEFLVTLNGPLPPGIHKIFIKQGTDGNSLLDICGHEIPAGDSVAFEVFPLVPTALDSITKPGCSPTSIQLVFEKGIQCSSIAANGSDFIVTGPTAINISSAMGSNCINGLSNTILLELSAPIQTGGIYTVTIQNGSDGNTIFNECGVATLLNESANFVAADTVNAAFSYNINYGCAKNTVHYFHNGNHNINSWQWIFDNLSTSNQQNPVKDYFEFNNRNIQLIVSNGTCSDTTQLNLAFANFIKADFEATALVCPNELVSLKNNTQSNSAITNWQWTFDNTTNSALPNPPPILFTNDFRNTVIEKPIRLIATNSYGCKDTAIKYVKVVNNCFIAVPAAFTPNGDGLNDYFYPLNAYKANNLKFYVYDRFGKLVFYTTNWQQRWNGRIKGADADAGTYVWMLYYTHADTGKKVEQKGTVVLIR